MMRFLSFISRRRKRDDNNYEFKAEHVIILSLENSNSVNTDTEVLLFVLDPSSTSLLPDKALSSEQLKKLLDQGQKYLTYVNMKSVSTVKSRSSGEESTGEKSSSKAPVVAGVVVAIVVLIAIVFVAWLYIRRRKNKRYTLCSEFFLVYLQSFQLLSGIPSPLQYESHPMRACVDCELNNVAHIASLLWTKLCDHKSLIQLS